MLKSDLHTEVFSHFHQWIGSALNAEERLTYWMSVQPFLSEVLIQSNNTGELTHFLNVCSSILVGGSDLLKHWRMTHPLDRCSALFISGPKHWGVTYILNGCWAIFISGSNPHH